MNGHSSDELHLFTKGVECLGAIGLHYLINIGDFESEEGTGRGHGSSRADGVMAVRWVDQDSGE